MNIAGDALLVDQHLGRHTAELEQLYFLPVFFENAGLGVGQTAEGQAFLCEVVRERLGVFAPENENGRVPFHKLIVVPAQLRHVRAAVWSGEAAVEDEQDVLFFFVIRKADRAALIILQRKVRRC